MSALEPRASSRRLFSRIRIPIALLIAPLIPGILFAIPDLLKGDPMAGWYIRFSATAGYPVTLVLGVPIYFWSMRKDWTKLPNYLLIGLCLGVAGYFSAFLPGLIMGAPGIGYAMATTLLYLPVAAACGVVASVSFWLIARPDQIGKGRSSWKQS
jgi:hypothetical protein